MIHGFSKQTDAMKFAHDTARQEGKNIYVSRNTNGSYYCSDKAEWTNPWQTLLGRYNAHGEWRSLEVPHW